MKGATFNRSDLTALFEAAGAPHQMTGSRYICNPAPMDTDEDWIALDVGWHLFTALGKAGFEKNTDPELYDAMPDFWAFRLGEFNVVVTDEKSFFDRFCAATELAKTRNLLIKQDRIALFQSILYGNA